jgi:secreted PhoX family phosphatase
LSSALGGASLLAAGTASAAPLQIGPLQAPDRNGIRVPTDFTSRVVAISLMPVAGYSWHLFPDGGATFAQPDGGWIYVSNSETSRTRGGGASALRFAANGDIVSAYRILRDTSTNCAGGATPWGTWLSCEEVSLGFVHECDPTGATPAVRRRALGAFKHEAVAVDPVNRHLYLTEDETDGRLYRFRPTAYPNLDAGILEVAAVNSATRVVSWLRVPNPTPSSFQTPTRRQVAGSTAFNGGEGIFYSNGTIFFTTKGNNRVWALDTATQVLRVIYDVATSPTPVLSGVDNVTVAGNGRVLVAEDGGDLQICVLDGAGNAAPLLQVTGQTSTELTGPAFNPAGDRLYFSSQRGRSNGITYEVHGPFADLLR